MENWKRRRIWEAISPSRARRKHTQPQLRSDRHETLASISQEWSNGEEMGKVTTGSGGEEGHGEVSPLPREPARAARRRLKSPSLRRARPSSLATLISGIRVEPDGGGGFGPRRPGRGRAKWSQMCGWAPGSAVEPTGHPIKHALPAQLRRGQCGTTRRRCAMAQAARCPATAACSP